jgi:YD repeat-containing protein
MFRPFQNNILANRGQAPELNLRDFDRRNCETGRLSDVRTYDGTGAQTQMVDSTGTATYSYDDASRRTPITYPGGSNQVSYAYDAANRLSTVTDWNSNQTAYGYDDANRMMLSRSRERSVMLPNGVVGTSTYDDANRGDGLRNSATTGGNTTTSRGTSTPVYLTSSMTAASTSMAPG